MIFGIVIPANGFHNKEDTDSLFKTDIQYDSVIDADKHLDDSIALLKKENKEKTEHLQEIYQSCYENGELNNAKMYVYKDWRGDEKKTFCEIMARLVLEECDIHLGYWNGCQLWGFQKTDNRKQHLVENYNFTDLDARKTVFLLEHGSPFQWLYYKELVRDIVEKQYHYTVLVNGHYVGPYNYYESIIPDPAPEGIAEFVEQYIK